MGRSRALLISLAVPTVMVMATGPIGLSLSSEMESSSRELHGPIADIQAAVDDELHAGHRWIDSLERTLAEGATRPETITDLLARASAEDDAWAEARRALDAAGAGALDDPAAAAREQVQGFFSLFSEQYVTGEVPDDIGAQVAAAGEAYARFRSELDALDARVESELVAPTLETIADSSGQLHALVVFGIGSLLLFLLGAIVVVVRTTRRASAEEARVDAERARTLRRSEFESKLLRGLEMAKTERAVFELAAQAVSEGAPGRTAELLVADSSGAHFQRVAAVGDAGGGCDVISPLDCPATVRGQTSLWHDDRAIDTCPFVRGTGESATCVPVSVGGRTTGVVHVTGAVGHPPDGEELVAVEIVVRRASERIAMVRAFEQTSVHAYTDSLTGLPNRRAIEDRLREQQLRGTPYAVAYCDLDHFKQLNDRHGHEVGDRALRLFARVLRDTVRPTDLPGRFGGEEFLLLLPECDPGEAEAVLERVRDQLRAALADASVPAFTCSFGVATSRDGDSPEDVIRAADEALLRAKAAGRDRIVRADDLGAPVVDGAEHVVDADPALPHAV